jgi:hypothetical protein
MELIKADVFSMDGKRRILIVSFFDCTQVSSRKKHRKAGRIQEAFLMVFCLEAWKRRWFCHPPVDGGQNSPHQKQRFLGGCFATWFSMLYSRYILGKIEGNYDRDPLLSIIWKNFPLPPCLAFNVGENFIHPSYHITESLLRGRNSKYGGRSNR